MSVAETLTSFLLPMTQQMTALAVDAGMLAGEGEAGPDGGPPGDLFVQMNT